MIAVVDTNVVAYHLLNAPAHAEESRLALERASRLLAPMHWEVELTNVVWMAVRAGVLTEGDGPLQLGQAKRLGVESVATSPFVRARCCAPSGAACPSTTRCSSSSRCGPGVRS